MAYTKQGHCDYCEQPVTVPDDEIVRCERCWERHWNLYRNAKLPQPSPSSASGGENGKTARRFDWYTATESERDARIAFLESECERLGVWSSPIFQPAPPAPQEAADGPYYAMLKVYVKEHRGDNAVVFVQSEQPGLPHYPFTVPVSELSPIPQEAGR